MPEWGIALIGVGGLIAGAIISEIRHWLDRKQRFRVMTFEKRLETHQAALSQIQKLRHSIESKLSFEEKKVAIDNLLHWCEDN